MNAKATPVLLALLIAAIAVSTWLITENQNKQNQLLGDLVARVERMDRPTEPAAVRVDAGAPVQPAPPTTPGVVVTPEVVSPEPAPADKIEPIVTKVVVTESQPEVAVDDAVADDAKPAPADAVNVAVEAVDAAAPKPDAGEVLWEKFGPTIEQVITDLMAGRDEAVTKRFTKEYTERLATAGVDINAVMQMKREQNGALLRISSHQLLEHRLPTNGHAFRVTTVTENNPRFVFTITITDDMKIDGMQAR